MVRVLFFGAKGWIGGMIVKKWKELHPEDEVICSNVRVEFSNLSQLLSEINSVDIVFSTIGRTSGMGEDGKYINNIDYVETHLHENVRDNLASALLLAYVCTSLNKKLSYLGTGCIFSNNTRDEGCKSYTESSQPDYFGSAYSIVKGHTDNLMKLYDLRHLNFRIRMPITDDNNNKNFIHKISQFTKICSYPNSMTYLPDMIPVMIHMSREPAYVGTWNMVNTNPISHSDILDSYREIVNPSHTYTLIEESELGTLLKAKRSNNVLDNSLLCKHFPIRTIQECIQEALQHMKN